MTSEFLDADFLKVLWQVEAAALALSLAVILFAFEGLRSRESGILLGDFARVSFLQSILVLGVGSLLLDGAVLLGFGHDAPKGWAATWAVVVSALPLLLLPWLFREAIHASHRERLQSLRRSLLIEEVEGSVRRELLERVALNVLDQYCKAHGIELRVLFRGAIPQGARIVPARSSGSVHDISLISLDLLAQQVSAGGMTPPTVLYVRLGSSVSEGMPLAGIASGLHQRADSVTRKSVKVRPRPEETLQIRLDELHEEALDAIRLGRPASFDAIAELYRDTLMAIPRAWALYGQQYDEGAAGGLHPFTITHVDRLVQNLYEELAVALPLGNREIVGSAIYLPIGVAMRAGRLGASALVHRMIELPRHAYLMARRQISDADAREWATDRTRRAVVEFLDFGIVGPILDPHTPAQDRNNLARILRVTSLGIAEFVRESIEQQDFQTTSVVVQAWATAVQRL